MTVRPEWLRAEWSYRAYVRGLRLSLVSAIVIVLAIVSLKAGLLPDGAFAWLAGGGMAGGIISVLIGSVGWAAVPDKRRANLHQGAFLAMVGRDVVRGIPGRASG